MAIIINLEFTASTLNPSLQVGDSIYYTLPSDIQDVGGFITTNTPKFLGEVTDIIVNEQIDKTTIKVLDKLTASGDPSPFETAYFSFSKSGKVNHNDLIGYYNEVKFVNNSKQPAKLFAVGTEVTENSK